MDLTISCLVESCFRYTYYELCTTKKSLKIKPFFCLAKTHLCPAETHFVSGEGKLAFGEISFVLDQNTFVPGPSTLMSGENTIVYGENTIVCGDNTILLIINRLPINCQNLVSVAISNDPHFGSAAIEVKRCSSQPL